MSQSNLIVYVLLYNHFHLDSVVSQVPHFQSSGAGIRHSLYRISYETDYQEFGARSSTQAVTLLIFQACFKASYPIAASCSFPTVKDIGT
jgi:hypothetical protein